MKGLLIIIWVILFISGCSGNSQNAVNYYQFNTTPAVTSAAIPSGTLLLKPVKLIGVSDQQAIVQVHTNHSVSIANFNYWSEHPKHMLYKSAQQMLSSQLHGWQIINARVSTTFSDYFEVEIHVNDFAGHDDHGGIISGNWYIFSSKEGKKNLVKSSYFFKSNALKADGYQALISALEANWAALNSDIATELEALYGDK
ncbi:ABC-type transport auxiliary lipoprotein family protein [Pseudoalteromonas sp. MMG005]|uniref:PqiC family protein n=1 Tax=Pseudoalteromonas sp. MMG005 TaxID=2822682 RepID=UPI001B3A2B7D|nr:ABC-type transport auxiliary lipoprotein family protein [Pseudoalteromonas sp. MMG005]MBQ4847288.1 membrane integrity-associated transporter subunit PqiC [Pseudoalteromonas sp. MMG005]